MMKFKNNENCTFAERVSMISREILKEYPTINVNDAIRISSLCDTTGKVVDEDVIFRRYYYILWILGINNPLYSKIFKDMKRYCDGSLKNDLNKVLYDEIVKYDNNEIDEFPIISNFYLAED